MIYLDNAATTRVCKEAADAAVYAMRDVFGNPSSLHGLGIEAEKLVKVSAEIISSAIFARPDEIIFTSGATESNNLALFGLAENYGRRRKRVVTTAIEHPSVSEAVKRLGALGYEVVTVTPDENGQITADSLVNAVDGNTCLISAMYVNNETGYVLPIEKAFSRIKQLYPDCMTHCDLVQGFMKLPVKVKNLGADAVSISGHKVFAPKGIGALWIKKVVRVAPTAFGGGQQNGIRPGTKAVPLIYSFAKAVEVLSPTVELRLEKMRALQGFAFDKLKEAGAVINSSSDSSPYIISAALPGIKSETVLHFLEQKGIYVSSGSACSRGKKSSVLKAFGYGDSVADSTIRISMTHETSEEDISALAEALKEAAERLVRINKGR